MSFLADLWLPILVSAALVFIVSAIIHMGPFWHRNEFPPLAEQDRVQDALRPSGAAANALPLTPERVLALAQHAPSPRSPAP